MLLKKCRIANDKSIIFERIYEKLTTTSEYCYGCYFNEGSSFCSLYTYDKMLRELCNKDYNRIFKYSGKFGYKAHVVKKI